MARDKFHHEFRQALENEGWTVTGDPLTFKIGKIQVQIDLGAERIMSAQRGEEKIAVEIKTFSNFSFITALYEAIGKYILYRNVLLITEPKRELYLAIPEDIYKRFFREQVMATTLESEKFKLIVYNTNHQTIAQWIK